MSLREEITDFIYRLLLTSCITVFMFLEIYNFMDAELITRKNIISILLISLSFNVLLLIYHKIHLYILPAILLVIAVFAFIIDKEDISLILQSMLFKLLIIGFAAFVIFLTSDTSVAVNLILSVGLIIYMFILLFREIDIYPASPALALFYIAFSFTRFFRRTHDKNNARTRTYVTYLFPFLLIIPICVFLLPKPDEPINWNWAKQLYKITVDKINEIVHEISLKFASSGDEGLTIDFGFDDSMTYDNSSSDKAILEIRPESHIYGSCYLHGEIFNDFSDGRWNNTLESNNNYSYIDGFETFYGMINFDKDSINDVLKNTTLKIKYLDLTSRIMFAPSKITPSYTYKNSTDNSTTVKNEHVLFDERKTYGTEYTVDFFQLNYGSVPFLDYMNADIEDSEEILQITKGRYLKSDYTAVSLEDLKEYRNYVNKFYTSSSQVRDSVKDWIAVVTEGCTTDYEKLKAIEEMLSTYEYNLDGGELPDHVKTEGDFLNYFLLEAQSGYCVHYATAFCLIARCMGFPSRVIQGYKAPSASNNLITVMNSYGHTWPEVYFKGKGWISFEPTPGFGVERYGSWRIYSGKYSNVDQPEINYQAHQPDIPVLAEDEEYIKKHAERRVSGMLILIIASIVVISLMLLVIVTVIANRIKRKKLTPEKLYILEFKGIMAILKELKISRLTNETLEEFSDKCIPELDRLHLKVYGDKAMSAMSNTSAANEASSGEHDVSESSLTGAKKDRYKFCSVIKTYENFLYGHLALSDTEMNDISNIKDRLLLLMKRVYKATYPLHKLKLYIAGSVRS